jgi:DNA-binding MarR family transcriptional regulator
VCDASSATDNAQQPEAEPAGQELAQWANEIAAELRAIRRLLRQAFDADLAGADLTAAQVALLSVLAAEDGQGPASLSKRLHLSHSTVSGIVDRLARKGLVERRIDAGDRRVSRVFLAEPVAAYITNTLPVRQHGALLRAADRTTPEERAGIRAGLVGLRRLLGAGAGAPLDRPPPE